MGCWSSTETSCPALSLELSNCHQQNSNGKNHGGSKGKLVVKVKLVAQDAEILYLFLNFKTTFSNRPTGNRKQAMKPSITI